MEPARSDPLARQAFWEGVTMWYTLIGLALVLWVAAEAPWQRWLAVLSVCGMVGAGALLRRR